MGLRSRIYEDDYWVTVVGNCGIFGLKSECEIN